MGTEAQMHRRQEDPKSYFKSRDISRRKLKKGELVCEFKHQCEGSIVRCALIDDQNIVGFGRLKQIYLWDWEGKEVAGIQTASMIRNPDVENMSAQMSRDLIVCGDNSALSIFDRSTLKQLHDIKSRGAKEKEEAQEFLFTKLFRVAFDHREVAYSDGVGIEWRDLRDPNQVSLFVAGRTCSSFYWEPESNTFFYSCYFGPDNQGRNHDMIAMGDRRMPGQIVRQYSDFESWPAAIEVSGDRLFASDSRRYIKVFDINSTDVVATLNGHSDWVIDLRADDSVLISGGNDHQLRMWDLKTLECTATYGDWRRGTGLCWVQWNEDRLVTCSEESDCCVYVYKYGATDV